MNVALGHRPSHRVVHASVVCLSGAAAFLAIALSSTAEAAEPVAEAALRPGIWGLDFSPNGKWLAAGTNLRGEGGPVVVWSTSDWQPHIVRFEETGGLHVAFSPDGKLLAYSTRGPTVSLVDVESGDLVREIEGHMGTVFCVAFTPDGQSLVTSGDDGTIKLWDVATGSPQQSFDAQGKSVHGTAVSPDGRMLLAGSDSTARLWDLKTGEVRQSFGPRSSIVRRVAFSPDGRFFLVSSWDARCRVHESETGQVVLITSGGSDCGDLTADNRFLATAGLENAAQVFRVDLDGPTDEEAHEIEELIGRFADDDYDVREAASARIVEIGLVAEPLLREAMSSDDAEVRLRLRRLREQVRSPEPAVRLPGHAGDLEVVRFSLDGKFLATGCRGGDLKIWSVPEFEEVVTLHAPSEPKDANTAKTTSAGPQ